jgi:hypothetical protein
MVTSVNILLGVYSLAECPAADLQGNGAVEIDKVLVAVGNGLRGCPQ